MLFDDLRALGAGIVASLKDLAQTKLVTKALLPTRLCPPTKYFLADVLEDLVLANHLGHPVGEEIDVSIAMGGEHAYACMLANERVANGEGLVFFCDVVEGVGGDRVDEVGDVAADRVDGRRDNGCRHWCGRNEVGLFALLAAFALGLVPHSKSTSSANQLATSPKRCLAANLLRASYCAREASLLDHPCISQQSTIQLTHQIAGQHNEVALDGALHLRQPEEVASTGLVGEILGREDLWSRGGQRCEVGVLRHGGLNGLERLWWGDDSDI